MSVAADLCLRIRAQAAEFRQGVDAAKNAAKNMSKEISNSMKSAASSLSSSMNQMTGGISGMAQTAVQSFKGIVAGFKGMSGAIAATGIGAIIMAITVAIAGLVAAFKRSGEAGDKMAEIIGFLKGVLDFFIGQLVKVGEWLVKAFSDPKTAIKELWEAIKENLVTRFEGVIQLFQGGWEVIKNGAIGVALAIKGIFDKEAKEQAKEYFQAAADGALKVGEALVMISTGKTIDDIKEIGKEIKASGNAGLEVAKMEDALMDQKIINTTELAKMEADIAAKREDLAMADNKTDEGREKRAELIKQILAEQDKLSARKIAYAEAELALTKAKIAATAGDTSDESRLKIAEAQAKVDEVREQASRERIRFIRQETMLEQQQAADDKKALEEKLKLEEDVQKEIRKLTEETYLLGIDDDKKASYEKLRLDKEAALANVKETENAAELKTAIEANYLAKVAELDSQYKDQEQKERDEEKKKIEDEARNKLQTELANDTIIYSQKKALLDAAHKEGLVNEQEYQDSLKEIRAARNEQYAEAALSALDTISKFQEAAMNRELAAAGDDEEKKDKIRKKYAKKQKSIAIMQAIINGALGVTKAFADLGPIAGAIAAALVAASTIAQITVIKSQPLAKGGLAYDKTLVTVGEYTNARSNPEVIAPLDKLKSILGNPFQGGEVKFVIEQDKLVGILSNANNKNIYF